MKKAVLFLFHPETFVSVRNIGGCVRSGGLNIVGPAHVVLVHNHRITERQANTAHVAAGTQFTVGRLCKLDVVVRHLRPSCVVLSASVFELEGCLAFGFIKLGIVYPCQQIKRNNARLSNFGEGVVAEALERRYDGSVTNGPHGFGSFVSDHHVF